jgi:hypothetical protein
VTNLAIFITLHILSCKYILTIFATWQGAVQW